MTETTTAPLAKKPAKWRRWLTRGALMLLVASLVVRFTVKDRYPVANTVFYATPWTVICVLLLIVWRGLEVEKGRPEHRGRLWFAVAICFGLWVSTTWSPFWRTFHAETIRVITWNLGHGRFGLPALAAELAQLEPDIAVIVEADPKVGDVKAIFREAFPEHHVFRLGAGIVLLSRWPGGEPTTYEFGEGDVESRVREVEFQTPWGPCTVFGCDMASDILYVRRPHFEKLARVVSRKLDGAVIVAGDFNTPLDSVEFDRFRELSLKEAFETAGSGYQPTWPVPSPVLSLDQIWVNAPLQPVNCTRRWSWRTDHAASVATLRVPGHE